jgi:glutamate dehydrogenase (NADP+)
LNEEEAKTLVANGCICVAEGANMPTMPDSYCVPESKIMLQEKQQMQVVLQLQD